MSRESLADEKFKCSARERAVFEAGIKLATIYHQFVGTPVNLKSVGALEESIKEAIEVQPCVDSASVKIDRSVFPDSKDMFSYLSLTGDMIDAVVVIGYKGCKVTAEMRYDEELGYPLMFVSDIEE